MKKQELSVENYTIQKDRHYTGMSKRTTVKKSLKYSELISGTWT